MKRNLSIFLRSFSKFVLSSAVFLLLIISTNSIVFAQGYGEGSFGGGEYGEGAGGGTTPTTNSGSGSSGSTSQATQNAQCTESAGTQPPWLYGAIAQDTSSVVIYFTEASQPVNKYALQFGTKSGEYQYGVDNLAVTPASRMTYLVKDLQPGTTYYFKVRGGNGCATGPWSNEISVTTKSSITFNTLRLEETSFKTSSGSGKKIDSEEVSEGESAEEQDPEGYTVKVRVLDRQGKPVAGAQVTMHSEVQEATSDEDGWVTFNNVEKGDHRLIVAYDGFKGEQALNVTGDAKEVEIEIKVTPQRVIFSPIYLWTVGGAAVIISVLAYLLFKKKD